MSPGGGQLAGKVAAVTGATSGSGLAIAEHFAAEGTQTVLMARGEERLRALEAELGPSALGVVTDIGDPDSVRAAFAKITERFAKLDILINNVAVYTASNFEQLTDDVIDAQVRTNLLVAMYTCRAAIPLLRAAGGGDIVNTSSEATLEIFPFQAV